MKTITKTDAKAKGLKAYNGKQCPVCHTTERYTNSDKCIKCHQARNAARKPRGRGKVLPPVIVAPVTAKTEPKKKAVHWQRRVNPNVAYERDIRGVKTNTILEGLTGAPIEHQDWQIYATKITAVWNDTWQKAVPGIIETGKLLIEAKERVSHGAWETLTKVLPFSIRMAQMLMAIAGNPVLANTKHVSFLPPSWGTLYQLSRLPEPKLLAGIEAGTINSKTERKEVAALLGPDRQTKRDTKPKPAETFKAMAEEIEGYKAHIEELEAARKSERETEVGGLLSSIDDDALLAMKIVGLIGGGRVALLIEELQKLIPTSEAA